MKVQELRDLVWRNKGSITTDGLIVTYKGANEDIDFHSGDDIVAWIHPSEMGDLPEGLHFSSGARPHQMGRVFDFLRGPVIEIGKEEFPAMVLRINREGHFTVTDTADHPTQCGKVGHREYKYFVTIEAGNSNLTPEGFVMENAWCDEYFKKEYQDKTMKCDSCENMSQRAVKYFVDLFATHADLKNVDLRRIYVRLHGSAYSFIEAEWRA